MKYKIRYMTTALLLCLVLAWAFVHEGIIAIDNTPYADALPAYVSTSTLPFHTPLAENNMAAGGEPADRLAASSSSAFLTASMKLTFDDEFTSFNPYLDYKGNVTCDNNGTGTWQTVYYFCYRTMPANNEAEEYIDPNFLSYFNSVSSPLATTTARDPFSISNGVLNIEAKPSDQPLRTVLGPWAKYTSGLITTEYSFSQTYGYFEMRAKLPAGRGLWPAFWLLPVDRSWPPEIDAMEAFGGMNPTSGAGGTTQIHYASHVTGTGPSCGAWENMRVNVTAGFHTYGVDWESNAITYYFDGRPYAVCPGNAAANKPFYILINLAVGGAGSWPGTPSTANKWPAFLSIDYVRAWQHK